MRANFRRVLRDELRLTDAQVKWSYKLLPETEDDSTRARVLSLDGRVAVNEVADDGAASRILAWIESQQGELDISTPLKGAVFEVRQGYKSADAKRQNGDLANAAQALAHGYLPVLALMSTQINQVVEARYATGKWCVLLGRIGAKDPVHSTFDFLNDVVGYDLAGFFVRNTAQLRAGVESVLRHLLEPA